MKSVLFSRFKALPLVLLALAITLPLVAVAQLDRGQAREGWKMIEDGALVIDVRSESEYLDGHLEGALHIPYQNTDDLMYYIGENKDRPVVMYCGSGRRVGLAIDALERLGYTNLHNATGIEALLATEPGTVPQP
jgi:phage shock protein E